MRLQPIVAFGAAYGVAFGLALLPAAAQTADFLKIAKMACAPDRMMRCKAANTDCETREATARDKAQILVIDFASKKVVMRRDKEERPYGDVTEDKIDGETRNFSVTRSEGSGNTVAFKLRKDGKMDGVRDGGLIKMEVTCVPAT